MRPNTVKRRLTFREDRTDVVVRLAFRFVAGLPLNGRRCSNATFWRRGTRRVGVPAYLVTWRWWALAAGWQRAGIRLSLTAASALLALGLLAVIAR
jgi:hypothetical protein